MTERRRISSGVRCHRYLRCVEYGRAHGEFRGEVRPWATRVEVSRLIDPRVLIEIEGDAEL